MARDVGWGPPYKPTPPIFPADDPIAVGVRVELTRAAERRLHEEAAATVALGDKDVAEQVKDLKQQRRAYEAEREAAKERVKRLSDMIFDVNLKLLDLGVADPYAT